ncbi:MAG TPA: PKD domain-containing protein, partial [Chitinophagaceae bacterium]|nr:PKD domain-containing protein [Chitinophagaceae bacterium]
MKRIAIFFFCISCVIDAKADHITGGEMYYVSAGIRDGEYQYSGTLKLFMRCNSGRLFNDPTIITVFDRVTGEHIKDISVPLSNQENLTLYNSNPCISDPPVVCYMVGYFYFSLSLPPSANGYIIASQVNYRVANINNLGSYTQVGATYTAEIPATTAALPEAPKNSSAHFTGSDLVIICADNSFSYSFAAGDADGDVLRYSFCDAYAGGGGGTPGNSLPPSAPPYSRVPYALPEFSGSAPLGSKVQINPATGLISGIAPAEGKYVVTVCVEEIRNGVVIAVQRKDLQINIASCSIAAATLPAQFTVCRDTKTVTLQNLSTSALIKTFHWELFNKDNQVIFTSDEPSPSYSFADTGLYAVKLKINKNDICTDTASSVVRVYPGLRPAFTY